jgi:hypothetical protein
MWRFDLWKLNDAELKYQVKISNRFAALENFVNLDFNRAWGNSKENIKVSAKESLGHYKSNQHTPWFEEEC